MVIPFLSRTMGRPAWPCRAARGQCSLVLGAGQRFTRTVTFCDVGFNTVLPWKRTVTRSFLALPTLRADRLIVFENVHFSPTDAVRAVSSFLPFLTVSSTAPEQPEEALSLPRTTILTLPPKTFAVAPLPFSDG